MNGNSMSICLFSSLSCIQVRRTEGDDYINEKDEIYKSIHQRCSFTRECRVTMSIVENLDRNSDRVVDGKNDDKVRPILNKRTGTKKEQFAIRSFLRFCFDFRLKKFIIIESLIIIFFTTRITWIISDMLLPVRRMITRARASRGYHLALGLVLVIPFLILCIESQMSCLLSYELI